MSSDYFSAGACRSRVMPTLRGKYSTPSEAEKVMRDDSRPLLVANEEINEQALSTGIQKMAVSDHHLVRKCIQFALCLPCSL